MTRFFALQKAIYLAMLTAPAQRCGMTKNRTGFEA